MMSRMIAGAAMTSMLAIAGCSSGGDPTASTGTSSGTSTSTGTGGAGGGGGGGGGSNAGGGGGGGGGEACVIPTAKIPLGLLSGTMCNSMYPDTAAAAATIDGAFTPVAGGFQVVGATETVEILEIEPVIPTGTFVHLSYSCRPGFYGDAGAFIVLENLATLDGKANPSEDGSRLWFFAAAGGEVPAPKPLPFTMETSTVCMSGSLDLGFKTAEAVKLTGGGASVTVAPETEGTLTVTSGAQAGSYHVKNVDIKGLGFPGGDGSYDMNFTIARAD